MSHPSASPSSSGGSSVLASLRRLFGAAPAASSAAASSGRGHARPPPEESEAKRARYAHVPSNEPHADVIIPAPLRAAIPVPDDYAARVRRIMARGWPMSQAAAALDAHDFLAGPALQWLEQHRPQQVIARANAAAAAAAPHPAVPAAPTRFERLPPLPPPEALAAAEDISHLAVAPAASSSSASIAAGTSSTASSSSSSSSAAAAASSSALSSSPPPSLTWSCPACTYANPLSFHRCDMCGSEPLPSDVALMQARLANAKVVTCGICFEDLARDTDAFMPEQAAQCGHYFCKEDMRMYLLSKLDGGVGSLADLRCPGEPRCARLLSDAEADAALGPRDRARFRRFRRMQQLASDPTAVFCSTRGCDVVLFGRNNAAAGGSQAHPQLVCPDCGASVCFACRVPWHAGQTCAAYQSAQASLSASARALAQVEQERSFALFAANSANFRQCAQCRAWVEKSEGCEKMTCRCGYRFCHKCGSPEARCNCTGLNHIFFDHATVLNNWGRRR